LATWASICSLDHKTWCYITLRNISITKLTHQFNQVFCYMFIIT
jgi:hypothetical protein